MVTGRLLLWDHLQDQVSRILCPPGEDRIVSLLYNASIPSRLPPLININELMDADAYLLYRLNPHVIDHCTTRFDRSKSSTHPALAHDSRQRGQDEMNNDNLNEEDDDDVIIVECSLAEALSSLLADCSFTCPYLSVEDSTRDDPPHDIDQDVSLPDASSTKKELHTFPSLLMRF